MDKDIEFERIRNVGRSLGWEEVERRSEELVLEIKFRKRIPPEGAEIGAGPGPEAVGPG